MISHDNLIIKFEKSLLWLDYHRESFSISRYSNFSTQIAMLKPLGEYILTISLLSALKPDNPKYVDILKWAWKEMEEGRTFIRILLARPDLIIVVGIYSCFFQNGFRNDALDRIISHSARSVNANNIEFPVWRRIDLIYAFSKINLSEFPFFLRDSTWLASLPEPWTLNDDMAYAVTHEVFYLTDFGNKPLGMGNSISGYLKVWLPSWIQHYISLPNWDLVAEMIMAADCIGGLKWSNDPIEILLSAQRTDGSFPSPVSGGQFLYTEFDSEERREFITNYHTTLVSIMSMALRIYLPNRQTA